MTQDVSQEALFQDPIGLRLKQARVSQSLSIAEVGQQLKLPVAIIEAMERDDWARLGAPVYVRSYLGSYLRLVGLPESLAEQVAQSKPTPQLVPMGSRSRMRRVLDQSLRNAVQRKQLPATLDTARAAICLHAYIDGLLSQWLLVPESFSLQRDAELLVDSALDMLRESQALRR